MNHLYCNFCIYVTFYLICNFLLYLLIQCNKLERQTIHVKLSMRVSYSRICVRIMEPNDILFCSKLKFKLRNTTLLRSLYYKRSGTRMFSSGRFRTFHPNWSVLMSFHVDKTVDTFAQLKSMLALVS